MTDKEYLRYCRDMEKSFGEFNDRLERIYDEDGCISLRFLELLNHLYADRMHFCRCCSAFWRELAGRSFWFMKPRCYKRAVWYENLHRETLQARINVEIRIAQIKKFVELPKILGNES